MSDLQELAAFLASCEREDEFQTWWTFNGRCVAYSFERGAAVFLLFDYLLGIPSSRWREFRGQEARYLLENG